MNFNVVNFRERPDLYDLQEEICSRAFPEFLYYSDTASTFWEKMISYYGAFQFMLLAQDQVAGVINCLPMDLDVPVEALPDDAFDWAFAKSIRDYETGKKLNAAVGVQIKRTLCFEINTSVQGESSVGTSGPGDLRVGRFGIILIFKNLL